MSRCSRRLPAHRVLVRSHRPAAAAPRWAVELGVEFADATAGAHDGGDLLRHDWPSIPGPVRRRNDPVQRRDAGDQAIDGTGQPAGATAAAIRRSPDARRARCSSRDSRRTARRRRRPTAPPSPRGGPAARPSWPGSASGWRRARRTSRAVPGRASSASSAETTSSACSVPRCFATAARRAQPRRSASPRSRWRRCSPAGCCAPA